MYPTVKVRSHKFMQFISITNQKGCQGIDLFYELLTLPNCLIMS